MRKWIIGTLIVLLVAGIYWRLRARPRSLGEAYVGEPSVTIWSTTAQVRQAITEVHWGFPVEVLRRSGGQTQVRTVGGLVGWMDGHALLDMSSWEHEARLLTQVHSMSPQAAGHTKVFTNVRLEPGREATRLYQLPGGVAVSVLARAIADVPRSTSAPAANANKDELPKREDWLLISVVGSTVPAGAPAGSAGGQAAGATEDSSQANQAYLVTGNEDSQKPGGNTPSQPVPPLAGWVLGRFIDLDLPETVRDYATSAGMRPVAWFVLNRVASPSGERPQFLVAGEHGGEGQPCDFSLLRVYTWGAARERYETAFIESDLCGFFPIRVGRQSATGDPEFQFSALEETGPRQERVYAMHQTSVRRVRESPPGKSPIPAKRVAHPAASKH